MRSLMTPLRAVLLAVGSVALLAAVKETTADLPATQPGTPSLRFLSASQYINTVQATFGADIAIKVRFAPVKRTDGLVSVGSSAAVLTPGALDPLDSAARSIAEQVVAPQRRDYLIPCRPASAERADAACARAFLGRTGRLLYRRPMTESELSEKVTLASDAAAKSGDFYAGLASALSAMLTSPNFLFIRERIEPDPARNGGWRLDAYSKASRLSYLLWDSPPDDALLTAAARGELHQPGGLNRQVERMLASPLLARGARAFFTDFLVLEAYDNVVKDSIIYPAFTPRVAQDAREQILRTIVDQLVTQRGDYRDLFTTRRTILSAPLAAIYGVPMSIGPSEWAPYDFPPDSPRAGLLSQVGFLAQYAHPGRSSPTRRGRGIREVLLCQHVPDPPPNVDFSIVEDPHAKFRTARERLAAHNTDPVCRGCHMLTDPIGLGLEQFDGAGQFRTSEKGGVIDAKGNLDGKAFTDAASLGAAMHDSAALKSCIVRRLYSYGVGRPLVPSELKVAEALPTELDQQGYRYDEMLRLIVLNPNFFAIRPFDAPVIASAESSHHVAKN